MRSTFTIPKQSLTASRPSDLDHVLLVVGRVLDKIAHRGGVRRMLLCEVFEYVELLVIDLGDVNIEHAMVGRRIDRDLARGGIDADSGFQRLDDLDAVDAARLLDRLRPDPEALIGSHGEFGDVGIIGTEAVVASYNKGLGGF